MSCSSHESPPSRSCTEEGGGRAEGEERVYAAEVARMVQASVAREAVLGWGRSACSRGGAGARGKGRGAGLEL